MHPVKIGQELADTFHLESDFKEAISLLKKHQEKLSQHLGSTVVEYEPLFMRTENFLLQFEPKINPAAAPFVNYLLAYIKANEWKSHDGTEEMGCRKCTAIMVGPWSDSMLSHDEECPVMKAREWLGLL